MLFQALYSKITWFIILLNRKLNFDSFFNLVTWIIFFIFCLQNTDVKLHLWRFQSFRKATKHLPVRPATEQFAGKQTDEAWLLIIPLQGSVIALFFLEIITLQNFSLNYYFLDQSARSGLIVYWYIFSRKCCSDCVLPAVNFLIHIYLKMLEDFVSLTEKTQHCQLQRTSMPSLINLAHANCPYC